MRDYSNNLCAIIVVWATKTTHKNLSVHIHVNMWLIYWEIYTFMLISFIFQGEFVFLSMTYIGFVFC